ncbi:MAG: alanine racemase [Clostridiales bacterium]|nr:alanine racemase [Clostridiales bacterium]
MSHSPTTVEISLSAAEGNAAAIRAFLRGRARMMAVVKANAYGHGMVPYAIRALSAGADSLAVANVDEASALRDAGIAAPILVLGGTAESGAIAEAVARRVALCVYDRETLHAMAGAAARWDEPALAHLKIDTGMARVGVRGDAELRAMLDGFRDHPGVRMEGIFTHFAAADGDAEFTLLQAERFERAAAAAFQAGFRPIRHAAASSGIVFGERVWYDMVRPGIALYGASVSDSVPGLVPPMRVTTRPVRLVWAQPGETVGYGRTFEVSRPTRLMTLPIGYGDGYKRTLSNRAFALVRGLRAPIVGRVCMDQVALDVTDVPGAEMGDEVVLLGSQGQARITPDEMARWADTIPYEITLGFNPRVARRVIM